MNDLPQLATDGDSSKKKKTVGNEVRKQKKKKKTFDAVEMQTKKHPKIRIITKRTTTRAKSLIYHSRSSCATATHTYIYTHTTCAPNVRCLETQLVLQTWMQSCSSITTRVLLLVAQLSQGKQHHVTSTHRPEHGKRAGRLTNSSI